ncbi:hypothetical protein GCK32_011278 [Trichostrongylus colubriformis]|uniref:Olfactomedin-like domain-containing protein n=1 Tax=Trichostrongylus colubriformis TaxID=6319 RepID=A0AAN8IUL0_TRICO
MAQIILFWYDLETTDQIEAELGDIAHKDCGRLPDHTFEIMTLFRSQQPRQQTLPGQVAWYNPYQGLTMLHYNPVDSRLYFFDDRRLLSVNVRMDEDEPDYAD